MTAGTCAWCGGAMTRGTRGKTKRFCSTACRRAWETKAGWLGEKILNVVAREAEARAHPGSVRHSSRDLLVLISQYVEVALFDLATLAAEAHANNARVLLAREPGPAGVQTPPDPMSPTSKPGSRP